MTNTHIVDRSMPLPTSWAYFGLLLAGVLVLVGLPILLGVLFAVFYPSVPSGAWVVLVLIIVPGCVLGLKLRTWLVIRGSWAVAQAEIIDRSTQTTVGSYGRKYRRYYVILRFDSVRTDGSVEPVVVRARVSSVARHALADSVSVRYSRVYPHMLAIEGE